LVFDSSLAYPARCGPQPDRLILPAYAVALDSRGLYAIANKLASMLAIIIVPFQNAWGPLALAMRDDPGAPRTYAKVLTYFVAAGLGLALLLGLFAEVPPEVALGLFQPNPMMLIFMGIGVATAAAGLT